MNPRAVVCLLTALFVLACGRAGAAAPPPAHEQPLVLREADFGSTVTVSRGQHIALELIDRRPVPGSATVWTAESTQPGVVELTAQSHSTAGPARSGEYRASLVARRSGDAIIAIHGIATCEAMAKSNCPDQQQQISVRVT